MLKRPYFKFFPFNFTDPRQMKMDLDPLIKSSVFAWKTFDFLDPDLSATVFFTFNADPSPDPTRHQSDANLRPLACTAPF
jgi:hypothetical protein